MRKTSTRGKERSEGCARPRAETPPPEDARCVGRAGAGRVGVREDSRLREEWELFQHHCLKSSREGAQGASGEEKEALESV